MKLEDDRIIILCVLTHPFVRNPESDAAKGYERKKKEIEFLSIEAVKRRNEAKVEKEKWEKLFNKKK